MGVLEDCICVEIGSDTQNAEMLMFALGLWRCPACQFDVRMATEEYLGIPDAWLIMQSAQGNVRIDCWLLAAGQMSESFGLVSHSAERLKVR